jgi:hypothetical protein
MKHVTPFEIFENENMESLIPKIAIFSEGDYDKLKEYIKSNNIKTDLIPHHFTYEKYYRDNIKRGERGNNFFYIINDKVMLYPSPGYDKESKKLTDRDLNFPKSHRAAYIKDFRNITLENLYNNSEEILGYSIFLLDKLITKAKGMTKTKRTPFKVTPFNED